MRRALDEHRSDFDAIQDVEAEQALILAAMVEGQGPSAVAASRELRLVFEALAERLDDGTAAFLLALQTPLPHRQVDDDE